jgi:chaperone required for assembly of F1-ATPase
MLKPGAKRFYKEVAVAEDGGGFALLLDGKPVKTPAGHALRAPTRALAESIAGEWRAQGDIIVPDTMPLTKSLNTVLDRVAAHREEIIEDLAKYAGSDLLCYRADSPAELMLRQQEAWDPWLAWASERHGARLLVTLGMSHIVQSEEALARLRAAIAAHDDHALVALHAAITITGSAVLGLAFAARAITGEAAMQAALVDEDYQAELWGRDLEAERLRARRLAELKAAEAYLALLVLP